MTKIKPIHPGEILADEFLQPFSLSQYRLAKDIQVPPRRINEIVQGKRAISVDTALRLSKYLNTTPQFWLNLQTKYDLETHQSKKQSILSLITPITSFTNASFKKAPHPHRQS